MLITEGILHSDIHLTYCPVCGDHAEELVIGEVVRYFDADGDLIGFGHPGGPLALELRVLEIEYTTQFLHKNERAPGGHPCSNCAAEIYMQRKRFEEEVVAGGLHWACDACGLFGIIVKDDSQGFAAGVREAAGIQPPNQMGVKFTNCLQHETDGDNLTVRH